MTAHLLSQTPIGKDEMKRLTGIITSLFDNQESLEFRQPVDIKGLGLTDYLTIIKTPMDLGTVKKNLRAGKYKIIEECLNDIQIIWDNCKTYNAEGSWIWKQAEKLEKYTKKLIKMYLPTLQPHTNKAPRKYVDDGHHDSGNDSESADMVSYQDKLKMTQKVKQLSQEELGNVVKIIQEECASAWKEIDQDKYQIIVDFIKKDTFKKIDQYIESLTREVVEPLAKKVKQESLKKEQ